MPVAPSPPAQQIVSPIAMPNVMVHPPEEEDTPAWCLYDAAQPERPHSYHQHAHFNHQFQHNAPPYTYSTDEASPEYSQEQFDEIYEPTGSVAMMHSASSPHGSTHDRQRSFVDLLDNNDGEEPYDSDSEYGVHVDDDAETLEDPYHQQAQQSSSRMRDAANDSDVIEVVKVSRRNKNTDGQQQQQPITIQKVATLKSRASKVFRSLLRSKPSKTTVPDVPPLPAAASSVRPGSRSSTRRERESQENTNSSINNDPPNPSSLSRSNTPTMSRKGSRVLTQLFSGPSAKPQSVLSFDQPEPPSPTQPSSPQHPEPTPVPTPIAPPPVIASRPSYSSIGKSSLRSSVYHESQPPPHESRSTYRESLYEPSDALDQARLNASSPTPSTASRTTRRFSKLNLSRLFTFSGSASSGATSNSNSTPAVEEASAVASASNSSGTPLSPVEPPISVRPSKDESDELEATESGRTTPTSRTASHTSPSTASSASTSTATTTSTSKTGATSGSGSSSASDSTSGPQTPITSEPDLGSVRLVNPPSPLASSPPSIYSVDSFGSREIEPAAPMHNFDLLFETDKSLSLNLGLGIDLGGGSVGGSNGGSSVVGKGKPSSSTASKKRISSAGTFGSFMSGKRGSRVFSAPGGLMKGHPKQSMDKMQEDAKEDELEMRLDSFHFDDLSFDADRFRAEL